MRQMLGHLRLPLFGATGVAGLVGAFVGDARPAGIFAIALVAAALLHEG